MRVKPSPKHAKKIHAQLIAAMGSQPLDLHKPFLKLVAQAMRKAFNVKIHFKKNVEHLGYHWGEKRLIEVKSTGNSINMFATMCHEIVHQYCWDKKLFSRYHGQGQFTDKDDVSGTELYVENLGEQLFLLFFPSAIYQRTIHPGQGNKAKK